jgi:hypothetical protein
MKKIYIISIPAFFALAGCSGSYIVGVNSFAETKNPVPQGTCIYVTSEPNSKNHLFDKEIKAKIVELLSSHGFQPVDDPKAEYHLTFNYEIRFHTAENVGSVGSNNLTEGYNVEVNSGFYAPDVRTVWDEVLLIKIFRGSNEVWAGKAITSRDYEDKRQTIDYLLVGVFEFFGQNTGGQKNIEIKGKDRRIAALESHSE